MSMELAVQKIPTLAELVDDTEESIKDNALTVILNTEPPEKWLSPHPMAKVKNDKGVNVPLMYIPINKIEYLLTKIYGKWWVEIKSATCVANSAVVIARLYVTNPITNKVEWNDGIGAAPIQTDAGAGAMDWNKAKSNGVQIAMPAAETYAVKDAAEKFGKIFGRDLGRVGSMDYANLLKETPITLEDVSDLYDMKVDSLPAQVAADAKRIIDNQEQASYKKIFNQMKSL